MKKVCLFKVWRHECYNDSDCCNPYPETVPIAMWQEVSDEDYTILKEYICKRDDEEYVMLEYALPKDHKAAMDDFLKEIEIKKKEKEKKEEASRKRLATRQARAEKYKAERLSKKIAAYQEKIDKIKNNNA